MERSSSARGLVTLAVLAALLAGILISPVGAAGELTKQEVKKIAASVFKKKSAKLKLSCSKGTIAGGGVCFERNRRPAKYWSQASDRCFTAGRRLPTAAELNALWSSGKVDWGTATEVSSDVFLDSVWKYPAMGPNTISGVSIGVENPFRCVAERTN